MLLLAAVERRGGEIVPRYLTERDHAWLERLLDVYALGSGSRRADLEQRLLEPQLERCPRVKLRLATRVADRAALVRSDAVLAPRKLRALVFRARAASGAPRQQLLEQAGKALALEPGEVETALFGDLPGERRVGPLPWATAEELARAVNATIVAALLARCRCVRVRLSGGGEPVVQHARRMGLICVVERESEQLTLEVSGPFSLFRRTDLYGRALASLLPRLGECDGFELRADCTLPGSDETASLVVRSSDPVLLPPDDEADPGELRRRLLGDVATATTEWQLVPDPDPVRVDDTLHFFDFALCHRHDPAERWLIELVGFWTPEHLRARLARLRRAGIRRFVLCVDPSRGCAEGEPPEDPQLVRHRRRIDVREVLAIVESERHARQPRHQAGGGGRGERDHEVVVEATAGGLADGTGDGAGSGDQQQQRPGGAGVADRQHDEGGEGSPDGERD